MVEAQEHRILTPASMQVFQVVCPYKSELPADKKTSVLLFTCESTLSSQEIIWSKETSMGEGAQDKPHISKESGKTNLCNHCHCPVGQHYRKRQITLAKVLQWEVTQPENMNAYGSISLASISILTLLEELAKKKYTGNKNDGNIIVLWIQKETLSHDTYRILMPDS